MKELYKKMPLRIQNFIITMYNIYTLNKKFGYIPLINSMKRVEKKARCLPMHLSNKELLEKTNELFDYATKNVPFYRKKISAYQKLKELTDLKRVPILFKDMIRRNNSDFFSKEANIFNSLSLSTSGTTGTPLKIKVSKRDLRLRYKTLLNTFSDFGIDISKNYARFIGHDIFDKKNIHRRDFINNHLYLSIFDLTFNSVARYAKTLNYYKISTLEGYPSVIYTFAKLLKKRHIQVRYIKNVITTAEKLHPYQKELIEKVFNCKVFDYYGSNEQSILIYTCRYGKLHVANSTGILEVMDNKYKEAKGGEEGTMVVTSFTSHFMPLIRYKIGDNCIVSKEQECRCGNRGLILDEILGRDEDIFVTDEGRYITRVSLFLKELPQDVIESQLIFSNSKSLITLNYISTKDIDESEFKNFITKLQDRVGKLYEIRVKRVPKIEISKSGKRKAIKIED